MRSRLPNSTLRLEALESRDVPAFIPLPPFNGGLLSPQDVVSADFNKDGNADLAIADGTGGAVAISLGNGNGTFTTGTPLNSPSLDSSYVLSTADFNLDNNPDLVVTNRFGTLTDGSYVFLGLGDGTFDEARTLSTGNSEQGTNVGDFNNDGFPDVFGIQNFGFGYQVFLGDGTGGFTTINGTVFQGFSFGKVIVADFNNDNILDVVGASSYGGLAYLQGVGDGTFTNPQNTSTAPIFDYAPGDFNGDGFLDIALASDSGLRFLAGDGTGQFTDQGTIGSPGFPDRVLTGDFNNDGVADIVAVSPSGGEGSPFSAFVEVYYTTGPGEFTPDVGNPYNADPDGIALTALDADNDGNLDFALVGFGTLEPTAQVFLNGSPDATVTELVAIPNPSSPNLTVTLTATVVVAQGNPVTGTVTFFGPGGQILGTSDVGPDGVATLDIANFPLGSTLVTAVYSGDLRNLASTSDPYRVTVEQTRSVFTTTDAGGVVDVSDYFATGVGSSTVSFDAFELGIRFSTGVRVAGADFDGDGISDVLAGSGRGLSSFVAIVDGFNRQFAATFTPFEASFTGGTFVAAGDINGDGIPDVAVSADVGGGPRVRIFLSNLDGSYFEGADFFAIDDSNFRGGTRIALGDVNGDGYADLIVVAGPGGGPRVAIYNGRSLDLGGTPTRLVDDFFALDRTLTDGAYVAAGDVNGDGMFELIFGAGQGGTPRVVVYDAANVLSSALPTPFSSFLAGPATNSGGIRVAATDVNFDGLADVITGAGVGDGSNVSVYLAQSLGDSDPLPESIRDSYPGLVGGVYVG